MSDMTEFELYISINSAITKLIDEKKATKSKIQEKLDNPIGFKLSIADKLLLKRELNSIEERIRHLNELSRSIFFFRSEQVKGYEMPTALQEKLSNIHKILEESEQQELVRITNICISAASKGKRERLESLLNRINSLIKSLKLGVKSVPLLDSNSQPKKPYQTSTYSIIVDRMESIKQSQIASVRFSPVSASAVQESAVGTGDLAIVTDIEKMINDPAFDNNGLPKDIVKNIDKIKNAVIQKQNAHDLTTLISVALTDLNGDSTIDFTRLKDYLMQLRKHYTSIFTNATGYLNGFNLVALKKVIQKYHEDLLAKKVKESSQAQYRQLAKELERATRETPNDYERINALRDKMYALAKASGLDNAALFDASQAGKESYQHEKLVLETEKQIRDKAEQEKRETQNKSYEIMRRLALKELERTGGLEDSYEYRSGDIRSTLSLEEREARIQRKIDEMSRISSMTPEERGLEYLKQHNIIGQEATLADLSTQQLADFRYAFRDSSYEYVQEFKAAQKSQQPSLAEQTTTVYKDYLRYLAAIKDKTSAMKFSQFASEVYGMVSLEAELLENAQGVTL